VHWRDVNKVGLVAEFAKPFGIYTGAATNVQNGAPAHGQMSQHDFFRPCKFQQPPSTGESFIVGVFRIEADHVFHLVIRFNLRLSQMFTCPSQGHSNCHRRTGICWAAAFWMRLTDRGHSNANEL